jgi:peptide/nickel transport system substrate-binding protein
VVWRGLDAAAVTRLSQQVSRARSIRPPGGFNQTVLNGTRVLQLQLVPHLPDAGESRPAAGDRHSPAGRPHLRFGRARGVPGHLATFPLGGKVKPKVTWKNRINLTLGYDPSMPNGQDNATQIRNPTGEHRRAERPTAAWRANTDLTLVDRKAWTATALAWLQPYLDAPLPGAADTFARSRPCSARRRTTPRRISCSARCRSRPPST